MVPTSPTPNDQNPFSQNYRLRYPGDLAGFAAKTSSGHSMAVDSNPFLDTWATRYLGNDPQRRAAFEQAKRDVASEQSQTDIVNPGGFLAGGLDWARFGAFHAVRARMEQLLGNKYGVNVGSIQGGGDLNERPLNASGPTRQINLPSTARPSAVFASAPAASAPSRSPLMAGDAGSPSPYDLLLDPNAAPGGDPNSPAVKLAQLAAMDALRNSVDPGNRARALPREGTPDWYRRGDTVAAANRSNAALDSEMASNVDAGNYWRNQQPIEDYQLGQSLQKIGAQGDANATAANVRARSAEAIANLNAAVKSGQLSQQGATVALNALRGLLQSSQQYGDPATFSTYQPQFNAALGTLTAPGSGTGSGSGGGGGVRTAPSALPSDAVAPPDGSPMIRDMRNGGWAYWDGRGYKPGSGPKPAQ